LQWFDVLYPQKDKVFWIIEVVNSWEKIFMVGQIFKKLVKEKGEAYTMDGRRCSKPFSPNWKPRCVMDSKHIKCVPVVEWKQ
jgi:hypothetical protein